MPNAVKSQAIFEMPSGAAELQTYVGIIARLSPFIQTLQKKLGLDDEAIYELVADSYSNLKDALYADLKNRQAKRLAGDLDESLQATEAQIKAFREEAADLKRRNIPLRDPEADWDFLEGETGRLRKTVEMAEIQLHEIAMELEEVSRDYLAQLPHLFNEFQQRLEEQGRSLERQTRVRLFMHVLNALRERLAFETLEKSHRAIDLEACGRRGGGERG